MLAPTATEVGVDGEYYGVEEIVWVRRKENIRSAVNLVYNLTDAYTTYSMLVLQQISSRYSSIVSGLKARSMMSNPSKARTLSSEIREVKDKHQLMVDRSCQKLIGTMHRQRRNDEHRPLDPVFRLQQTKLGVYTEDGALHLVSERSDKVYLRLKTVGRR